MKITCPKCDFHPTPNILWKCNPGCGHKWHTFATHGICPRCSKMWHDTQCPHCKLWSPIDDWDREDMSERQPSVRRNRPETQEEVVALLPSRSGMISVLDRAFKGEL